MMAIPDGASRAGATNTTQGHSDVNSTVRPVSGDLSASSVRERIEALAALLEPEAFDPDVPAADEWRESTKDTALGYAAKVITSDYRRVVDDDTTVERVAQALAEHDGYEWCEGPDDAESTVDNPANPGYYRPRARAAVRALREDT